MNDGSGKTGHHALEHEAPLAPHHLWHIFLFSALIVLSVQGGFGVVQLRASMAHKILSLFSV